MGCANSKDAGPGSTELVPTSGGGSMIISSNGPGAGGQGRAGSSDSSLVVSKGGSYVLGRKAVGEWEPGAEIVRPENTPAMQVAYVPVNASTVLRVSYAAISEQGRSPRPPHKPNQDSFVTLPGLGNDPALAMFGVFDGHGPRGEDASQYCRVNLPDITVRQAVFARDPFTALERSFEIMHKQFISPTTSQAGVDTTVSGTTAIAVMIRGQQWICANVGDSRAIMGSYTAKGELVAKPLSIDHKPTRPDERARVNSAKAAKILSERALGIDGGDPDKYYICRVHNGSIRYGVLFTRSIGDADAHAYLGLTAEPEIKKGTLDPTRDKFFVLASDGVWDYVSDEQVAAIVARSPDDPQAAVTDITATARRRWDAESQHRRDDITAVVVMLKFMTVAEAEADKRERQAELGAPEAGAATDAGDHVDEGGRHIDEHDVAVDVDEAGAAASADDALLPDGDGQTAGAGAVAAAAPVRPDASELAGDEPANA